MKTREKTKVRRRIDVRHLSALLAGAAVLLAACGGSDGTAAGEAPVEVSVVDGEPADASGGDAPDGDDADNADDDANDNTADDGTTATTTASGGTDDQTTETTTANVVQSGNGDAVEAPDCGPVGTTAYEPWAPADIEPLATNQIVSADIEAFTIDNWRIPLCAGQVVFFDQLDQCSGDTQMRWKLIVPDGDENVSLDRLINSVGRCGGDFGPLEIDETGEYTIEVYYDEADDSSGSYKFEVLNVAPPDVFDIAVGDEVGPGVPGAGAGSLEFPGSRDLYRISLEAGQRVFFDAEDQCDGDDQLRWRLIVPDGDEQVSLDRLINSVGRCGGDAGPLVVDTAGVYTIEVHYEPEDDGTADEYGFTVVDASGG